MSSQNPISRSIRFVKENRKKMFWLWISYQAIKGSLTLTLIWIPLFLLWKQKGGLETFIPDWGGFLVTNGIFIASHVLIFQRPIKLTITGAIGKGSYWVFVSIVSFLTFATALWQALEAPQDVIWQHTSWHSWVAFVLIFSGLGLITFGAAIANPLSIFAHSNGFDPSSPGFVAISRHPVLWGILFWSLGHIIANGTAGLVSFFAVQIVFCLIGMVMLDRRMRRQYSAEEWNRLAENTSFFPNLLRLFTSAWLSDELKRSSLIRLFIWLTVGVGLILMHRCVFLVDPLLSAGLSF